MRQPKALFGFALENFGPVLVFYGVNHFYGLKPAILVSTLYSIAEIASKLRRGKELTPLFKFSAAMTLVFGAVDLYSQQSFLFKYEASVSNVFTGLFFGASLFSEKSVLEEFRAKGGYTAPMTADRVAYLKILTAVWTGYFFLKAAIYAWMASRYSLEQALVIRTVVGSGSFYALLFVSIVGSRKIFPWMKAHRLLPSVASS